MSGHSKWSTIKRKKGAADAKRSKVFSRIVKEIQIAVKQSGSDPDSNPSLRVALQNAKGSNMPKSTVEKAISKGESGTENFEEITFEGYGPDGVAIFVECLSDNNNRTVSEIRAIFTKYNGSLGKNGSLSYLFNRKAVFTIAKDLISEIDDFELEVIDAGAEEIELVDDKYIITAAFEDFGNMQKKLEEMKIEPESSEAVRIPNVEKEITVHTAEKNMKIIDAFEENDDVQNVFHDMGLTDEIIEALNDTE
ncbi:MAG: YebC/PmpR family DNA-binding transcriptional regulator [Bacteroidota bacterium]|nr:YebC/PmpR family DNA-binding transcriptional regulator [Bacteroidota bacterium]